MVGKRGFFGVVLFVLILSALNMISFLDGKNRPSSIYGMFIKDLPGIPSKGDISLVVFIVQWFILLLILILAYSRFLKHKKEKLTKEEYSIVKKKKKKSETDLDILYGILKNKKTLSITTISKLFKISKEKALEWAKILENHELVKIEYPAFTDPEVKINERNVEKENEKTEEKEQEGDKKRKAGKGAGAKAGEKKGK